MQFADETARLGEGRDGAPQGEERVRRLGTHHHGIDIKEMFRLAAAYVDRILRGAKPAELPVQQPTKYELVINLRAARALGLGVPPALLARVDELVE